MIPTLQLGQFGRAASSSSLGLPTWNASDKDADITLSGGDLIATLVNGSGTVYGGVRAGITRNASENRYFEVTVSGADIRSFPGVGKSTAVILNQAPGNVGPDSYGYFPQPDDTYANGTPTITHLPVQQIIGVAVDFAAGTIKFIKAGQFLSVAFTSFTGPLFPAWGPGSIVSSRAGTLNTGGSAWAYGPPAGFSAWGGTWNSADKGANVVLSGGDLIATVASGGGSVRGTVSFSSGKRYFEVSYSSDALHLPGVSNSSATLAQYPGYDANGWGIFTFDNEKYTSAAGAVIAQATSATIGISLNAGNLRFIVEGTTGPVAAASLTGDFYPMWGSGTTTTGTRSGTLNLGASAFEWPLPSGATAWGS